MHTHLRAKLKTLKGCKKVTLHNRKRNRKLLLRSTCTCKVHRELNPITYARIWPILDRRLTDVFDKPGLVNPKTSMKLLR